MNITSRKTRLIEKLQNKEYRDSYVSSNIDVGVAFQIRALRKQRKYTQTKLADIAHMKQGPISVLENPSNTPNISTLKKIANAFDVGLIVRFVPISNLVEWQLNLSCESLDASSFNEDPCFQENPVEDEQYKVEESFTQASSNVFQMEDYRPKRANLSPQKNPRTMASAESYVINK